MGNSLVTGGLGFIGRFLVRQLLDEGDEVVVYARKNVLPRAAQDLKGRIKIVKGDVKNFVRLLDTVREHRIDSIYHTSATMVLDCEQSPAECFQTNVMGTANIFEAARLQPVSNLLYISTGMAYGSEPPRKIYDDTPHHPTLMYATTKECCEHIGDYYHRKYGLNFRAIRFPMVIGPGREISHFFGDYSGAVELPARGEPYTIHVDPDNISCLIYVKDVAGALIALKKADEGKLRQRVYNAQGFNATMREVAAAVKRVLPGAQIEFDWDQSEEMRQANSAVYYELDNTAAQEDFGWQPRYLLDKMVQDFAKEIKVELERRQP
jgi:nucleoside-diphosphate-sugar epimerase